MNDLVCIHCQSKNIGHLLNGEYYCEGCHLIFSAGQFKDYLCEKVEEAKVMTGQNVCGRCGKKLSDPHWCSWCGSDPLSPEDVIRELNEQIYAADQIIAAGEPEEYRKARTGDQQAISRVFAISCGRSSQWKSLIDLGSAAVPFLIDEFKHADANRQGSDAEKALIEIGDQRAIEPLMEAASY